MFFKKVILIVMIFICTSFQVESQNKPVVCYGGLGLTASTTSSNFKMNYVPNWRCFMGTPYELNHNRPHIKNVSGEIFVGVKSGCSRGFFWAIEANYGFSRVRHTKDFLGTEYCEITDSCRRSGRNSYINIKHGNELGLEVKLGGSINGYNIYSIAGATTKKIKLNYGLDTAHRHVLKPLEINSQKRVYGAIIGLGVSKNVTNKISCSLEYKYKIYGNANIDVDWKKATLPVFSNRGYLHDTTDRHFSVKSDRHEVSSKIAINI